MYDIGRIDGCSREYELCQGYEKRGRGGEFDIKCMLTYRRALSEKLCPCICRFWMMMGQSSFRALSAKAIATCQARPSSFQF